ncbi:MAG: metallophosphoesterase [Chitinophagaceae bacterium]|nr:metallophosphoesterase [Chitinophagaceae bacterium]
MKIFFSIFFCFVIIHASGQFVVPPYLQVGEHPSSTSLRLLWQATAMDTSWKVEYNTGKEWIDAEAIIRTIIASNTTSKIHLYDALFSKLISGQQFNYRVYKSNQIAFSANAIAPKSANQPYRFIAVGDLGAGTKESVQIAKRMFSEKPDLLAISGDIIYENGLVSEYKTKFWPIYNAEIKDYAIGAPLMRSVPFMAAVGNHDADTRDLDKYPDALAFYQFWRLPLNGPVGKEGGAFVPLLKGSEENINAFKNASGNRYPRMTNYSYDYGNSHWTVLDADTYVDWTDSLLKKWVADDINSSTATWKFVLFNHPGFNSANEHYEQQQMRALSPIFENGHVDIVFTGHVHNYQRTFPMYFTPFGKGTLMVGGKDGKAPRGRVINGKWKLDKQFDGISSTKPDGVIYIVTGAGGQTLYNPEQEKDPDTWQKFTYKFVSTIHSFTVVDVNDKKLSFKQVDTKGRIIDSFNIIK